MSVYCGRISFCSRFQDSTGLFYCIFSLILRALPTIYSLSPLKLPDLSPSLGTDLFSILRRLHTALGKKYILPSTLLNYRIARIRAAGSQELTKSICNGTAGLLDPEHASLQGQKADPAVHPARKEGSRPPVGSWSLPHRQCFARVGSGINVPGIFYCLLILFTSFCFTIKQISTWMNIKALSPHKR